jgi:hypothetical protein
LGQIQERRPKADGNQDLLQDDMQSGQTDGGARDAAGNAAIARALADLGPNPSMSDLVDEMKKQSVFFPEPSEGSEKDPASADAGFLRELLMRLSTDSSELSADLANVRNVSHRVSKSGGTYASAAAAVCALAVQAIALLQKPADAPSP